MNSWFWRYSGKKIYIMPFNLINHSKNLVVKWCLLQKRFSSSVTVEKRNLTKRNVLSVVNIGEHQKRRAVRLFLPEKNVISSFGGADKTMSSGKLRGPSKVGSICSRIAAASHAHFCVKTYGAAAGSLKSLVRRRGGTDFWDFPFVFDETFSDLFSGETRSREISRIARRRKNNNDKQRFPPWPFAFRRAVCAHETRPNY